MFLCWVACASVFAVAPWLSNDALMSVVVLFFFLWCCLLIASDYWLLSLTVRCIMLLFSGG